MSRRLNSGKSYKKTKQEQYSLLIRRIGKFCCDGSVKDKNTISHFWNELKDKLNSLGPPTRNITEWKKVWNDCKRSRRRREHIRIAIKNCKEESTDEDNNDTRSYKFDHSESNYIEDLISLQDSTSQQSSPHQAEFAPNESNSMYNGYTAEHVPDQDQHNLHMEPDNDEYATNFPTLSTHRDQQYERHGHRRFESVNFPLTYSESFGPPPLHEATTATSRNEERNSLPESTSSSLLQHTLYTLQNQMDHQTKMLENMSRISGSMALLMERQVLAIEKQTEAVRRQAVATEHHTLVMNSFVDMIKDRMPKFSNNLNRTTNSTRDQK